MSTRFHRLRPASAFATGAALSFVFGLAGAGCTGPDEYFRHRNDAGEPVEGSGGSGDVTGGGGAAGPVGTGGRITPAGSGGQTVSGSGGAVTSGSGGRVATGSGGTTGTIGPTVPSFFDDFEDGSVGGWYLSPKVTPDKGVTFVSAADGAGKVMQVATPMGTEALLSAGKVSWTDQAVEAKVKIVSGSASSARVFIYARVRDMDNYYFMYIDDTEVQVRKRFIPAGSTSASSTTLAKIKFPTGTSATIGTWYTLKLVISGNTVTGYFNGTPSTPFVDTTDFISNGAIGVGVAESGTVAAFDDVRASLP